MHIFTGDKTSLIVAILTLFLMFLQIIFAFLMKKKKEVFKKYHQTLGVLMFFVVLLNALLLPTIFPISITVLFLVLAQIIIGFLVSKGDKKLIKYHRSLGIFIFILIIINLVFIFPGK